MLICDKCKNQIKDGFKFCPFCGDEVTEKDVVKNKVVTNEKSATIIFGYSSSPNYEKAVSICLNLPNYDCIINDRQTQHKATIPLTEIELITNIYDLVGNWKSSSMIINGRKCTKKDLTYYGIGCYKEWLKAYDKTQYCFGNNDYDINIWGCKKLNLPFYLWGGGWIDYGSFDKKGTWHFDKARIKKELLDRIAEIDLCPKFDKSKVLAVLNIIPDSINPRFNKNWAYRTEVDYIGGERREIAIGIKPKSKAIYYLLPKDFKPSWDLTQFYEFDFEDENKFRYSNDDWAMYGDNNSGLKKLTSKLKGLLGK